MWHDHPFGQRNKKTERAVGLRVWRQQRGWTKFEKEGWGGGRGAQQYRGSS